MLRFTQMTLKLGDESLNILGPKIFNHHLSNIQSERSVIKFDEYINTWFGPECKCSIGRIIDSSHDFSYCYLFLCTRIFYIRNQ